MRLVKVKKTQEEKTSLDGRLTLVFSVLHINEVTAEPDTEETIQDVYQVWNVTEVWNLKEESD